MPGSINWGETTACVVRKGEPATLPESESFTPYCTPSDILMEWYRYGILMVGRGPKDPRQAESSILQRDFGNCKPMSVFDSSRADFLKGGSWDLERQWWALRVPVVLYKETQSNQWAWISADKCYFLPASWTDQRTSFYLKSSWRGHRYNCLVQTFNQPVWIRDSMLGSPGSHPQGF